MVGYPRDSEFYRHNTKTACYWKHTRKYIINWLLILNLPDKKFFFFQRVWFRKHLGPGWEKFLTLQIRISFSLCHGIVYHLVRELFFLKNSSLICNSTVIQQYILIFIQFNVWIVLASSLSLFSNILPFFSTNWRSYTRFLACLFQLYFLRPAWKHVPVI